ncbi:methyltransferase domain-containing protein [Hymenobacter busanensis]|uniref:Methyltransferase domain-containing protein n=1 Tax=Hymenobacter busanensis TaxID=2607656 RepID=A0A7L5A1J6_9BACT|nr:methyltransferase domain-containing protein [Hymenobacter busanensis]KAA9338225.1 methyltransferase domain-containing protein [Hymenobacter busanensis]QHJ09351.1 methyltransferase domain-containing protein [Hymenobacter busanensis]
MDSQPFDAVYWTSRYHAGRDGWDVGTITEPLRAYFAQLGAPDQRRILIPGAGRAYEAEWLHRHGWPHVFVADIAPEALEALQARVPDFPAEHLLLADFFALQGPFDLIVEQTFFCALDPGQRPAYARQCAQLLRPGGKLVGLLFDGPVGPGNEPPFGGSREEYRAYFAPYFDFVHFDTAHNSIKPRAGRELFICLQRKAS